MRFARGCGGWDSAATKLFSLAAPEFAREAARRGSQVYRFREGVRHGSLEQAAAGSIEPETHLSGCKWNQQLAGEFLESWNSAAGFVSGHRLQPCRNTSVAKGFSL